jgi:lipoprotein-anchoring transpeptidase ErfK/SrfK
MSRRMALVAAGAAALLLAGCGAATRPAGPDPSPAGVSSPAATGGSSPTATGAAPAVVASPSSPGSTASAAGPARPKPSACVNNQAGQLVKVSLQAQHLWMCERSRLVYSAAITSGIVGPDTSTPTGDYTIQGRNRDTVLTINTGAQYNVKYWIPFDAPLFGFHDSSWQDFPYGSAEYKTQGSHGCVHLPLGAIAFLYKWADIGAKVTIRA